jgi:hypothetical protein
LSEHDLTSKYEKDIFIHPLSNGLERTYVENYARFALALELIQSPDQFFTKYPELFDALPLEGNVESFGSGLWELFKRHEKTVNEVIELKITEHASDIRRGELPDTCLLSIIASGQHLEDIIERFIVRLRELVCISLPPAFQTVSAENERHVQDVGESVFQAVSREIMRETPQIPYAVVSTKPDFSLIRNKKSALFIEFKFVKDRSALNRIITEMTSRITVYTDQGADVLFIVYDPNRAITNDRRFIAQFEKHKEIWVGISR